MRVRARAARIAYGSVGMDDLHLPKPLKRIRIKGGIKADERYAFDKGLRDNDAIEWVAMMEWQHLARPVLGGS